MSATSDGVSAIGSAPTSILTSTLLTQTNITPSKEKLKKNGLKKRMKSTKFGLPTIVEEASSGENDAIERSPTQLVTTPVTSPANVTKHIQVLSSELENRRKEARELKHILSLMQSHHESQINKLQQAYKSQLRTMRHDQERHSSTIQVIVRQAVAQAVTQLLSELRSIILAESDSSPQSHTSRIVKQECKAYLSVSNMRRNPWKDYIQAQESEFKFQANGKIANIQQIQNYIVATKDKKAPSRSTIRMYYQHEVAPPWHCYIPG
jgi:hypothetical protein